MAKNKIIVITGIVFILIWISKMPYLFPHPFQQNNGLKQLSQEAENIPEFIKELSGLGNLSASEIENRMTSELRTNWIISITTIILGCLAGFLLIKRNSWGRVLALCLSFIIVGYRLINLFSSEYWRDRLSLKAYALRFEYFPIQTIQEETTFILFIITIYVLLMPSTAKIFKHNKTLNADG